MIDSPDVAVFHIQHDGDCSIVKRVKNPTERFEVAVDLGYRASDILQANCIIWVEGPSDRLYLQHWLNSVAPNLLEGIHYSIMFYGGRLLSHLSANDEEVNDFIDLRRINRNLAIIIDSDRRRKGARMNDTKIRVRNEFDKGPGFAWVTAGREIENYVSPEMMIAALRRIYPDANRLHSEDPFDERYFFYPRGSAQIKKADKVKLAREIATLEVDWDVLDLSEKIKQVAAFICHCNDLPLGD
jgi:hypothetical protein